MGDEFDVDDMLEAPYKVKKEKARSSEVRLVPFVFCLCIFAFSCFGATLLYTLAMGMKRVSRSTREQTRLEF